MPPLLRFSIVINTDSRAAALGETLRSLRHLDYPAFEVCVVYGPTADGTRELLASWNGEIKVAACAVRDLTVSRNIGIALAAGDVVAFLDDDAIPEPEWLADLAAAYDAPEVGGAGGFVRDFTGVAFQCRYTTLDRLGVEHPHACATPELNYPGAAEFPHLLGTNCSFRRVALIAAGGFDEQIGRYLDESDVCCRMIDRGWTLRQVAGAVVHHRLMPDDLRTSERVIRSWYPLVKNKLYFPLVNGRRHHDLDAIVGNARRFARRLAEDLEWAIVKGRLGVADRHRFRSETARAWRDGLAAGLAGARRLIDQATLRRHARPFLPFPTTGPPGGRKRFCLLSQDYPPERPGGIARYVHQLARSMASRGHHIHVLTRGREGDLVAFEDEVWVHRIVPRPFETPTLNDGLRVPLHIWNYARTMQDEIVQIAEGRRVDCVYAPLWDGEGLAVLLDGRFPLVTALPTPLRFFLDHNPDLAANPRFMAEFATPMLAAEKRLLAGSAGIHVYSAAVVRDIEEAYQVVLPPQRVGLVPLGLADWRAMPSTPPAPLPEGATRILFVGRLEARKGIDVLLAAAETLLAERPHCILDIVGSDPRGYGARSVRDRMRFHGEVGDEVLRGFYHAADIVVAPSRYESFGLVALEAMMFAKPVVGCCVGGMPEVIEHGVTGLLAEPGDAASLGECLARLIDEPALRRAMGAAARARYEERFTAAHASDVLAEFLSRVASDHPAHPPSEHPRLAGTNVMAIAPTAPTRIALVCSILARHDAISAAVRHMLGALQRDRRFAVSVLAARNDFPEIPVHVVDGLGTLLLHPAFLSADVIIYHFGIFHPFFDALIAGSGEARQVVVFHNVTPPELAGPEQRPVLGASFRQLFNLRHADRLWPVSETNAAVLVDRGFDPAKIDVMPLAVDRPPFGDLAEKPAGPVELLFVGRIVAAKGVLDLVAAVDLVRRASDVPFGVTIAGNMEFSDRAYVAKVKAEIAQRRLGGVRFLGTVSDATLMRLYRNAHVLVLPSYHEGFGVPVIEGLRAGCVPVGYAAHNLPRAAGGLGRMVPCGDREALAAALIEVVAGLAQSVGRPDAPLLPLDRGLLSRRAFDRAARAQVAPFEADAVAAAIRRGIAGVLGLPMTGAPRRAFA